MSFTLAVLAGAACTSGVQKQAPAPTASVRQAAFTNGGFEDGTTTGWTITTGRYTTLAAVPPTSRSQLNIVAGGVNRTGARTGAVESQIPSGLTAASTLRYPRYGSYSGVVNEAGASNNVNALKQSMTVAVGDVDPADGKVHIRFALAPVLQNPGHPTNQQPYFWVELRNATRGTQLFQTFNFANQAGVPWKTDVAGSVQYTDWQSFDVAPGNVALQVGDTVDLEVIAAGCGQGGHWGEVYVDAFGAFIPGLSIAASAPQQAGAGTDITYTFLVSNGGTGAASNVVATENLPAGTTFVSYSAPGMSCTAPAVGGTGAVVCTLSGLNPAASATFTVTVNINAGATGKVSNGNYLVQGTGISPLIGPLVETTITSGVTYADLSITKTDGVAAVAWGQAITYTIDVANAGPTAVTGATVTDPLPANLTGATWTCAGSGGGTCGAASGSDSLGTTADLPVGAHAVYTVSATVVAGSGSGSLSNTATVATPGGITDPNSNDNAAIDNDSVGTLFSLTVTKAGSGSGTVVSSPAAISCGAGCSAQFIGGASVSLTATAAAGHTFTGWSGACTGTTNPCVLTISGDTAVAATFTAPSHAVATSVSGGNGTFTCPSPVADGQPVTCTASPAAGYHLATLTDNGADVFSSVSGGQYTIASVTAAHGLSATFAIDTYAITTSAGSGGSVSPSGTQTVAYGQSLSVSVTPSQYFHVADVVVDGASVGAVASYAFVNVVGPHSLAASFARTTHTVAASGSGAGGSISCPSPVDEGTSQACTLTPAAGSVLASLTDNGAEVLGSVSSGSYSLGTVLADHTLVATFLKDRGTGCGGAAECGTGFCVDGVCCNTACGGGGSDCQACSAAAGAAADGTCGGSTGNSCDDGDLCTQTDACQAGACTGTNPVVCGASDQCHQAGSCDPGSGTCSNPARADGSSCDDGDVCTTGDACTAGGCAGQPVVCTALDECHLAGVCQASSGACTTPDAVDDTACNAGAGRCVSGGCHPADGQGCADDTGCASGHCADGRCCDSTCSGQCQACDVAGSEGSCVAVTGAPHGGRPACESDGTACAGACDGADPSACAYPGAGTSCRAASCAADVATLAESCTGSGRCPAEQTQPCGTFVCGATACLGDCTADGDCASGHWCSGGVCVAKLADGAGCGGGNQCGSGECVDGLCCNVACGSQCEACDVPGHQGECTAVSGAPHGTRTACASDGSSCGGACDGAARTTCAFPDGSARCRDASCTADTATLPAFCDGAGACPTLSTQHCGRFTCGPSQCLGDCAADADCAADSWCSGGVCVAKGAPGELCSGANQCGTGFCADGVCCASACGGQCEACDAVGHLGQCTAVAGAPRASRPACQGDGTVCAGACDGAERTACSYPAAETACRPASCTSAVATLAASCDGAGACPAIETQGCGAYACGATACRGDCTADGDCTAGQWCSGGVCAPVKAPGAACAGGNQCGSGSCVDGVCCASACGGQCEACDVPGHLGQCVPVTGAPHGGRGACAGDGSACAGACDGTASGACAYPGAATECRGASCAAGVAVSRAACGGAGHCPQVSTTVCQAYVCGSDACETACADGSACADGFTCAQGACRPSEVVAAEAEAARQAHLSQFGVSGSGCGCQSPGSTTAWGAALVALWALARRRRAGAAAVAVAVASALAPSSAQAQAPSITTSFGVQRFQPESGALDIFGVESPRTPGHLRWSVVLYGNYAQAPLKMWNKSGNGEVLSLVSGQTGLDLGASLGLFDRYELAVVVPVTVYQSGAGAGGLDPTLDQPLASAGFADARVVPKARLYSHQGFHLGLSLPLTLPIGLSTAYLGHGALTANPRVAVEYGGRVRGLASVGVVLRDPRRLLDLTVGTALTYGIAGELPFVVKAQQFDALAALQGEVGFEAAGPQQTPLELQLGLRWHTPLPGLAVALGGGPGLTRGYGTPTYRLLASVGFTPVEEEVRAPAPPPALKLEPLVARPDEARVERDGSVEVAVLDNDSGGERGQLRVVDVTQGAAGTATFSPAGVATYTPRPGFEGKDEFGYTLRDARGRTSFARVRVAVVAPADRDGDGIPDQADRCPELAETANGFEDGDGCPDQVPAPPVQTKVVVESQRLVILEKVFFATNKDVILDRSFDVLHQVAAAMKAHPELKQVRVEGHTDNQGPAAFNVDLSQRRALSVKRFLTQQGIDPARLGSAGYGPARPIAPNTTADGRASNRRVEFIVVDRGE